jgi:hypothetical protein
MKTADITLVFQGAFKPYVTRDLETFVRNIKRTRKVLPGARLILSTWEGADVPCDLGIDELVLSKDPGGLAPLKLDDQKANNCNRQLITTQAGLAAVTTRYAVKMRTDCFLEHAGFLDFHAEQLKRDEGRERLVACSFFTLDPSVFERIPYHLSDWFHFGPTELLQAYWSAEPLSPEHARFYETHPHAEGSSFFEKKFRARFAVEQYICTQYAGALGYACPRFLNDVSDKVMRDFYRFLGREVMLLDPWQIGLVFNKYEWVGASSFQRMNNLMNLDWLAIHDPQLGGRSDAPRLRSLIEQRVRKKNAVRLGFRYSRLLHPFLFDPQRKGKPVRKAASLLLRHL